MQRLKTRAQFQAVRTATTVSRTPHFALHRIELGVLPQPVRVGSWQLRALFPGQDVWVGALIPKRWAKRAVTRNAIKRQIHNVSQALDSQSFPAAHLVRLRAGFDRQQFHSAISNELKRVVRSELMALFALATP